MTEILRNLASLLEKPYSRAEQEKQKGRKIVGVTPMHFPEELVHASGALPVIMQESSEPVTVGFGHIYPFYCGFTRSNVDLAAKGKQGLFDAIVVSDMCLQTRQMAHIMRMHMRKTPFVYVQWPLEAKDDRWLNSTIAKLGKCREQLEKALDKKITDAAIADSIAIYNKNRALLREVYELRKQKPGVIKAKELMTLVMSSMVLPKEEHNQMLEDLIAQLKKSPVHANGAVRLFVSGHLCHAVKADILDLIEDFGGTVVDDDIFTGYRYIATDTAANLTPMEALARHYLDLSMPCPTRSDPNQDWANYMVKQSRASKAQGIVILVVKFCEPHMIYYPHIKETLAAEGIPHILLETEHEVVSLEGARTRIQAFIEMLRK